MTFVEAFLKSPKNMMRKEIGLEPETVQWVTLKDNDPTLVVTNKDRLCGE